MQGQGLWGGTAGEVIYTYIYLKNMFPKVGLLEETEGGGKEK
jgi:hypothetical protein